MTGDSPDQPLSPVPRSTLNRWTLRTPFQGAIASVESQAINRRGSGPKGSLYSPVAVMMSVYGPLTRLYWRRSPGLVRGNEQRVSSRALSRSRGALSPAGP